MPSRNQVEGDILVALQGLQAAVAAHTESIGYLVRSVVALQERVSNLERWQELEAEFRAGEDW